MTLARVSRQLGFNFWFAVLLNIIVPDEGVRLLVSTLHVSELRSDYDDLGETTVDLLGP